MKKHHLDIASQLAFFSPLCVDNKWMRGTEYVISGL